MDKKPPVTLRQLRGIEKTYPTPFYICDKRGIRENAARPRQVFSWDKGYKEYFAVKATPNPFLSNILEDMRCDVDCPSMIELMMPKICDFSGLDIVFSSSDMPPGEFTYARKLGAIINPDDITHIQYLGETLGHILETVSCHFNPGGLFRISNDTMDNPGDPRYGVITEQIGQVLEILKEKGAKHFGIHVFLASNMVTNKYYPMLIKTPFGLAVKLKEETGARIVFINLFGGIGVPCRSGQEPNDILTIGGGVRRIYGEILILVGMEDVALCTELGCFMMGPYGALVTKVIHEKHIYKEHVGADVCAVNLTRLTMYGAYHHITVTERKNEPCTRTYDVVGPLCGNNDRFTIDRMLPKVRRGDLLFIHDAGAHGFAMGYNYDGKLKPVGPLLKGDDTVGMIRRAEIPEGYFAVFDLCDILRDIER